MFNQLFTSSFLLPFLSPNSSGYKTYRNIEVIDDKNDFWRSEAWLKSSNASIISIVLLWLNYYDNRKSCGLYYPDDDCNIDISINGNTTVREFIRQVSSRVSEKGRAEVFDDGDECGVVFDADSQFNSSLNVSVNTVDLTVDIIYHEQRFSVAQMDYISSQLANFLSSINLDNTISDLVNIRPEDKEYLLDVCNDTEYPFEALSIPSKLSGLTKKYPDNVAISQQEKAYTFSQLDIISRKISSQLQHIVAKGVVGVYLPRSPESLAAVLGIWRAGLTYLPLIVEYPTLHLLHMCSENNVSHILVGDDALLPNGFDDFEVININNINPENTFPDIELLADSPAAVMYTSGSTGMPKGVEHSWASVSNRFLWWLKQYPVRSDEVFSQRTALSFIPSLWELLSCVVSGQRSVVIADEEISAPDLLANRVQEDKITRLALLPSFLNSILNSYPDFFKKCTSLRYLVLAGEPVSAELLGKIKLQTPHLIVINDYGATETNGVLFSDSSEYLCNQSLPTGKPIANCQAYVLNEKQELLPIGVKGELYIGGIAATSSYVNLPTLNDEKYLNYDFDGVSKRIYRTNDRAIRMVDGSIQVLGRCDNQVKIRGIRVELESVEQAILQCDGVKETAAFSEKTPQGTTRLVAQVVKSNVADDLKGIDIVQWLKGRVTEACIPARIDVVSALPRTANGKLNRKALNNGAGSVHSINKNQLEKSDPVVLACEPKVTISAEDIIDAVAQASGMSPVEVSLTEQFSCQGIDSAAAVSFIAALSKAANQQLSVTLLYEYTTPAAMLQHLTKSDEKKIESTVGVRTLSTKVAVVGMACHFPNGENPETFWNNLAAGVDSVQEIPASRWKWQDVFDEDPSIPGKTNSRWGSFIDDIDSFDARFFNISSIEAKYMAPEQRVLLQKCWHAIEDAGYSERDFYGRPVGVFVGARPADYAERIQQAGIQPDATTLLGNDNAILAARIAYYMNLKGPAITVDTACSSSAVALHMACESIHRGESDMALAGGISLVTTPTQYQVNTKAGMLSPTGRCQTFDQGANGFVQGEGGGVVVLKSLEAAVADNDRIYAVIETSAINQDGKTNGITAPSGEAQKKLLASIYNDNNIDAKKLAFIEAHGTGTKLGDPIEFNAINSIIGSQLSGQSQCALGSTKTNIGHLISAAGIAGFIKVAMSLHHRKLPPILHYKKTNEHIDLESSPFFINTDLRELPEEHCLAGVSSFGFSGTNCHMVLGSFPHRAQKSKNTSLPSLLLLSAKDQAGLIRNCISLRDWLVENPGENLVDLSYTFARRANYFDALIVCTAQTVEQVIVALDATIKGQESSHILLPPSLSSSVYAGVHFSALANQLLDKLSATTAACDIEALNSLAVLIANGVDVNLRSLYENAGAVLLSVPGYAFEKERFWIDLPSGNGESAISDSDIPSFKAQLLRDGARFSIDADGRQQWSLNFTCARESFDGHIIGDQVWWPATAQLDVLQSVCQQHLGVPAGLQLQHWELGLPCVLEDEKTIVELILTQATNDQWAFKFYKAKKLFSCGVLLANTQLYRGPSIDVKALRLRCAQEIDSPTFYRNMATSGINYGPAFQRLQRIMVGPQQVLSKVCLPDTHLKNAHAYRVELFDAALHGLAAGLQSGEYKQGSRQPVPVGLERFIWTGEMPAEFGVYTQLSDKAGDAIQANIWLFDSKGNVFAWFHNLQLHTVVESVTSIDNSHMKNNTLKPLIFVPSWIDAAPRPVAQEQSICWVGEAPEFKTLRLHSVFSHYSQAVNNMKHSETPVDKIVWRLSEMQKLTLNEHCGQLIDFIVQLTSTTKFEGKVLLICEHSDQWCDELLALSGTVAALTQEYPKIHIRLAHSNDWNATSLVSEIQDTTEHQLIHRMPNQRVTPLWSRHTPQKFVHKEKVPEVSLITGGLGGVGRVLAAQLSQQVNAGVVLVGRRAVSQDDLRWIKSLRTDGAEVVYLQGDVSSEADCLRLMKQVRLRFGQLDALYHCAGITRDALAINKKQAQIDEVMSAKVASCQYLDQASRIFSVKKFVLFSSISAVLGTAGQADYGAANAYLDAFARRRNADKNLQGRTLSINWPLWDVAGMRPDPASEAWLRDHMGMYPMPPKLGIALIDQLLADELDHAMVLYGNEQKLTQFISQHLISANQPLQASA